MVKKYTVPAANCQKGAPVMMFFGVKYGRRMLRVQELAKSREIMRKLIRYEDPLVLHKSRKEKWACNTTERLHFRLKIKTKHFKRIKITV